VKGPRERSSGGSSAPLQIQPLNHLPAICGRTLRHFGVRVNKLIYGYVKKKPQRDWNTTDTSDLSVYHIMSRFQFKCFRLFTLSVALYGCETWCL